MEQNSLENTAQIVYFSHGGGPLPILGDASHQAMLEFIRGFQHNSANRMLSWWSAPIGKNLKRP